MLIGDRPEVVVSEENKALVRRFYEEIDNGNVDAIDDLVAEDYVDHSPFPFPVPPGREGLKAAFKILWDATPGRHEIEEQIAEGDKVVTRLTATASTKAISRWHPDGKRDKGDGHGDSPRRGWQAGREVVQQG